jgi:hypothetical protein
MDDDGLFFLQIAGLRKSWQFEDLTWVPCPVVSRLTN